MKKIQLNLVISLIMESVKGETIIKGKIDKAVDDKASALAFNEEAGNEEFHERKLLRTLHSSVSKLKTKIGDYLEGKFSTSSDNISSEIKGDTDSILITLLVSDRFNESFVDPLAKLCSKYIEDHMLYLWWGTFNQKQADFYKSLLETDLEDILSCFTKTAPEIPSTKFPSHITTQMGSLYECNKGDEITLTYEVSDDVIDDVEISLWDGNFKVIGKRNQSFILKALSVGVSKAILYSKHNDTVECQITIICR